METEVTILNSQGLHARPAAQVVRITGKYPGCEVTIYKDDGMSVNGKSIMGIMMLAAGPGTQLRLVAEGPGADRVLSELRGLIESRFGEEG